MTSEIAAALHISAPRRFQLTLITPTPIELSFYVLAGVWLAGIAAEHNKTIRLHY
ncbi:MAG: hypothetical protein AAGK79_03380 [Pseudomonadota bacterium]